MVSADDSVRVVSVVEYVNKLFVLVLPPVLRLCWVVGLSGHNVTGDSHKVWLLLLEQLGEHLLCHQVELCILSKVCISELHDLELILPVESHSDGLTVLIVIGHS